MFEGTLTARTQFEDGRVSCMQDVEDGPATWVKIFGSMASAKRYAEVYDLEFIDLCTPYQEEM